MLEAIEEAGKGRDEGGIPIGSVLVRNNVILGRGRNRRVQEGDPVIHEPGDFARFDLSLHHRRPSSG